MNCTEAQEVIHGYLDGELDPVHNLAVARHLQECAACARKFRDHESLRKVMARESLYFDAPKSLEKRLRSALRQTAKAELPRQSPRWTWSWSRLLMPLAAVSVVVLIAIPLTWRTSTEGSLTHEIVSAHVRSLMVSHLTDVASSDQHTVKPWFNGKLPFSPTVTDLAPQGFPLIGGRLDYLENHPVAALVYQRRQHFINLFIWPSSHFWSANREFRTPQGYNAIHWRQNAMEYWAVSDMNLGDLHGFAQLIQGGPPLPPAK